jgi:chorismate lyase
MRTVKLIQPDAWRQMPPAGRLRPWLTYRGSLTSRIVEHFDRFNLVRLSQHLARPNRDEHRALDLRSGELAVIREVLLRDGTTPLVFAHTAANPRDLRGAWRGLSRLGARPLAEMLFQDPTVVRMPMEYQRLRATHRLALSVQQHHLTSGNLWARRSVFLKAGRPLLVTEVFLPAILAHP